MIVPLPSKHCSSGPSVVCTQSTTVLGEPQLYVIVPGRSCCGGTELRARSAGRGGVEPAGDGPMVDALGAAIAAPIGALCDAEDAATLDVADQVAVTFVASLLAVAVLMTLAFRGLGAATH